MQTATNLTYTRRKRSESGEEMTAHQVVKQGILRLKRESVTPGLHAQIALLVNASDSCPVTFPGVGSNLALGRLGIVAMQ